MASGKLLTNHDAAAVLMQAIAVLQGEGDLPDGAVYDSQSGMKASARAAARRRNEVVHVYLDDDDQNPLTISIDRLYRR